MDVQIDVTNVIIDTPRLILRSWQESDLDDFYEYASVDGVGEMAGWKHHESLEESRSILRDFIVEKNNFALQLKSSGKAIGSLGLHYSWANDDERYANLKTKKIGYVLSKDYWGQGLMPEAVSAVVRYCFDAVGVDLLTIEHFIGNNQSKRVIEKNGFTYVGQGEFVSPSLNATIPELRYVRYRK